jgi:hypothetical protein
MSLYVFGKIVGAVSQRRALSELCDRLNIIVSYDSLEAEDCEEIDRAIESSTKEGDYFAIYSTREDAEATELWLEAREAAMGVLQSEGIDPFVSSLSDALKIDFPDSYSSVILQSRLGRLIEGLQQLSANAIIAITLVDGGIERIKNGPTDDSVAEIFKSFILPWDCSPNTLYILDREVRPAS